MGDRRISGDQPSWSERQAKSADGLAQMQAYRMMNNGQSCIAAKRLIVEESVLEAFETRLITEMQSYKMGDPLEESTKLGPLARPDLRDELHDQVEASVKAGAMILLGGEKPDRPGAYYPATILTGVKPGMPAYSEELFGPVASVISARDTRDAIRIANDTVFGLGAAIFSKDTARATRIAEKELHAGAVFINDFVKSDPRLPFGGIKQSGYGRELSAFGIREFVNVKTISRA